MWAGSGSFSAESALFPVMSNSGDEVYHSAEEKEDEGVEGKEEGVGSLARDLREMQISGSAANSAGVVEGEESSSDGTGSDNDESTHSHDTTREDVTGETRSKDGEATGGATQTPGPVSDERPVEEKLTEEEAKERKEQAGKMKAEGNDTFKRGEYAQAVQCYTEALKCYPPSCDHEVAICYANRAACYMKLEDHQSVIDDCSKALELKSDYLKAYVRRAQAYEAVEKYEDALEDYKKVLAMDPSQATARQAMMYLPEKITEQREKLKAEMLGKLKELGNAILNPFGLSTDNFQLQQDPNTGGYSINFNR